MNRSEVLDQLVSDVRAEASRTLAGKITIELDGNQIRVFTSNDPCPVAKVYNIDPPRPIPPKGTPVLHPGSMELGWSCGNMGPDDCLRVVENYYAASHASGFPTHLWKCWVVLNKKDGEG
jgi:hypothetical protein